MAKAHRARHTRSARGRSARAKEEGRAAAPAAALVDEPGRRFPWPAEAGLRRYGIETPYLAIVNARGPWAVWKHARANPPFIPLCLDLLGKEFWRCADNGQRVFALTCWMRAAQEEDWGIVWGDPVRLCTQWRLDPATFTARLEWMIGAGLACYLTAAEAEVARSWRPARRRAEKWGGNTRGGQEQAESSKQGQAEQASQEPAGPAGSQDSSPSASAQQIPESKGQGQAEPEQSQPSTASKSQHRAQATPQGTEPVNLPKSDHGAGDGSPRTTRGVRGRNRNPRPPSVSEPVRMGDLLGWGNPAAVEFGRGMYEAITGHRPPADLTTAPDEVKGDVGVWVHYWVTQVERALSPGQYADFRERCYRDVAKKRKVRGIISLGRVAMGKPGGKPGIVPGILKAMRV